MTDELVDRGGREGEPGVCCRRHGRWKNEGEASQEGKESAQHESQESETDEEDHGVEEERMTRGIGSMEVITDGIINEIKTYMDHSERLTENIALQCDREKQ